MARNKIYSRGITTLKCLAPANAQSDIPSFILLMTTVVDAAVLRKTLALCSVQISQEISIISEASVLGDSERRYTFPFHHSHTEPLADQVVA